MLRPRHPELESSIFVSYVGRPILTDWPVQPNF